MSKILSFEESGAPLSVGEVFSSTFMDKVFRVIDFIDRRDSNVQVHEAVAFLLLIHFTGQLEYKICLLPEFLIEKSKLERERVINQRFKFVSNDTGQWRIEPA